MNSHRCLVTAPEVVKTLMYHAWKCTGIKTGFYIYNTRTKHLTVERLIKAVKGTYTRTRTFVEARWRFKLLLFAFDAEVRLQKTRGRESDDVFKPTSKGPARNAENDGEYSD